MANDLLTDDDLNLMIVRPGGFIRAQYATWSKPRNGLVLTVEEYYLQAAYLPPEGGALEYFIIKSSEVMRGEWKIRYSNNAKDYYELIP